MIASLKAAHWSEKLLFAIYAVGFTVAAAQLHPAAFAFFAFAGFQLRVLKLEHKLRALGVEP